MIYIAIAAAFLMYGWMIYNATRRSYTPRKRAPRITIYPRIVGGEGVWAAEINDFDNALVQTGETSYTVMRMENAKAKYPDARGNQ